MQVVITTYQTLSGCFSKDKKKKKVDAFVPPDDSDLDDSDDDGNFRGAPKKLAFCSTSRDYPALTPAQDWPVGEDQVVACCPG
jgi:hypothetical protein